MRSEREFAALLEWLDPDRDRAGERYEQARRKLIKIFQWRGCEHPEEYADRSLDRVARRVAEGEAGNIRDPWVYIHGVALNVLREYWRSTEQRRVPWEQTVLEEIPAESEAPGLKQQSEGRLACLDNCLSKLPRETQKLVIRYHEVRGGQKIKVRKTLADAMGISLGALRIRLCRIRGGLEQCVQGCVEAYEEQK